MSATTTKLMTATEAQPLTLITTTTEAHVDSRMLALQLGGKHKAVIESLTKHKADFLKLGKVPFQTEALPSGQREKFALLNEDQSFFLLTLSRNNRRVVNLKMLMVKAFGEVRKALDLHRTEYLPAYHELHDGIHALAAGSTHEQQAHINVNKLLNKVVGIGAGQRGTASRPVKSLLVVAQMMAAQAMQSAHNHRDGYQKAKAALTPLLALTAAASTTLLEVGAS